VHRVGGRALGERAIVVGELGGPLTVAPVGGWMLVERQASAVITDAAAIAGCAAVGCDPQNTSNHAPFLLESH